MKPARDDVEQLLRSAESMVARRAAASREAPDQLEVLRLALSMQQEILRQVRFELEKSRERYLDFYDLSPVGYVTLSAQGLISEINLTGARLLGKDRERLWHRCFSRFVTDEHQERWQHHFMATLQNDETQSIELALQRRDASRFFARLDCRRLNKPGEIPVLRIVLTDISERIRDEKVVRKLAFYDALTQLPNRRLLNDRLEQAMAASRRSGLYGALLFLDLDNFKPLNDRYGHNLGDQLLVEVGLRISGCVREMDTVARFGGDEFVVLLSELHADHGQSETQARQIAEKIRAILAEPYQLNALSEDGQHISVAHHCSASIGVVVFVNHEERQQDLLKWADMAMCQAKAEGRNRVSFLVRK